MRSKILWVAMSCLLIVVLLAAACASAPAQPQAGQTVTGKTTPQTTAPAQTQTSTVPPKQTTAADTPKYGGIFSVGFAADITGFDDAATANNLTYTVKQTNEELVQGDWTRGPAGTGEFDWVLGGANRISSKGPSIAESWELPDNQTMIFHIRKGILWQNKAPTNGRELTADDVAFSLNRYNTVPTAYIKNAYPGLASTTTITATDRYTVVIKCQPQYYGDAITLYPDFASIYPQDAVEKFGDMKDWRNALGSGPFMLTDFVSNSSATFVKNPTYWAKDPIGPGKGNQLPYLDGIKYLIIPDLSTRYAALRTGKIDYVTGVSWDDAVGIQKTNPELVPFKYASDSSYIIYMRTDKKDLPYSDVRVRQALYLAMDKDQIINTYYGGNAVPLAWPVIQTKEYAGAYVPLDKLPADVQELYETYNVTKAKQLLADAGYPGGFKMKLVCYNTSSQVDLLSLIKSQWAKIGVEVTIDAREYAIWLSNLATRNYEEAIYGYNSGIGTYFKMINYNGTSQYNGSYINDPTIVAAKVQMDAAISGGFDETKMDKIEADLMPYLLQQAYVISPPWPFYWAFWSPWLKNFHGEGMVGYYNYLTFAKYVWVDQDLKTKMGK